MTLTLCDALTTTERGVEHPHEVASRASDCQPFEPVSARAGLLVHHDNGTQHTYFTTSLSKSWSVRCINDAFACVMYCVL